MRTTTFLLLATLVILMLGMSLTLFAPAVVEGAIYQSTILWLAGIGYLLVLLFFNPPSKKKLQTASGDLVHWMKKNRATFWSMLRSWQLVVGVLLLVGILYMTVFIQIPGEQGDMTVFTTTISLLRNTLKIALLASIVSISLGTIMGLFAAYLEGWFAKIVNYIVDTVLIIPFYLLAVMILLRAGRSLQNIIFIIAIYGMVKTIKLIQGQVLVLKEMEFVTAARAIGQNPMGVMFKEIVPVLSTILYTQFLTLVATNITIESSLGLIGIVPNSIGRLIVKKLNRLLYESDWSFVTPVSLLIITIMAFILIGQGIQKVKFKG